MQSFKNNFIHQITSIKVNHKWFSCFRFTENPKKMAAKIIDMQLMRYINLFSKVAKVPTTNCFVYNNVIIFAVPRQLVSKAVGKAGVNVKKLGETLRKKIKIIEMPKNEEGVEKFVVDVISPVEFNKIEVRDNLAVISAGRESKAALIGRGRVREQELGSILHKAFGISGVRII